MMTNLLTEESPQVYHPTLATWIGINEAMFLAQLNFVLTRNESVGKFADGRKWYRDKPKDFVIKYFPFWDEGIVKRVIDNLRADGILLARSDLNKDPKDRSLWYTISYEAIERLTGPLERITNKSQKRKEARAARKSKEDNSNEYTKVQNVLLSDNEVKKEEIKPEAAKVQSVPTDNISTKRTIDPGTNCTLPSVQNVLTPKDSYPKESLPKERAAEERRPSPVQAYRVFVEETKRSCLNLQQIKAINDAVGTDPAALEKWRETVKAWNLQGNKLTNAAGMLDWFTTGKRSNYEPDKFRSATNGNGQVPPPKPSPLTPAQKAAARALNNDHQAAVAETTQRVNGLLAAGVTVAGVDVDRELRKPTKHDTAPSARPNMKPAEARG